MIKGIYSSAAAMRAGIVRQDLTANNLANASTTGFKRDRFVIEQQLDGANVGDSRNLLDAVKGAGYTAFSAGPLESTEAPLDFALQGSGFFVVTDQDGTHYTRNGRFDRNAEGQLVDAEGRRVQGEGGDLTIPPGIVTVSDDGRVSVDGVSLDRLRVVEFENPGELVKTKDSLFSDPNNAAGERAVARTSVAQGFLEQSNVDAVREMVEMIATARHYEASSRLMTAQDASLNHVVNDIGRV
ncbi:MAG: flagellar basal-body rod protein FlgF [bacterium]|nr:flagellar basal-body rod protein FlgF [bacterium]